MDIKKAWPKLLLAVGAIVVAVLAVVMIINTLSITGSDAFKAQVDALEGDALSEFKAGPNSVLFTHIGILIAGLGIAAVAVLSALGKAEDKLGLIIIGVAAVTIILVVVGMLIGNGSSEIIYLRDEVTAAKDALQAAKDASAPQEIIDLAKTGVDMAKFALRTQTYPNYFYLITFGIAPLAYGLKKLFSKEA